LHAKDEPWNNKDEEEVGHTGYTWVNVWDVVPVQHTTFCGHREPLQPGPAITIYQGNLKTERAVPPSLSAISRNLAVMVSGGQLPSGKYSS